VCGGGVDVTFVDHHAALKRALGADFSPMPTVRWLGNYVHDGTHWRRATAYEHFARLVKKHYTPDYIDALVFGGSSPKASR
jgi:hypothetical protein